MNIAIFGVGGHSKVVTEIAELAGYNGIYYFDDSYNRKTNIEKVLHGDFSDLLTKINSFDAIHIAIGNNSDRERKLKEIEKIGITAISLIHPSAIISETVTIGNGCVVMAGVIVNSCSNIGDGVIINTRACIDHDCNIGNYTHISPGVSISGGVKIGMNSWVGTGSALINNIHIGDNVIVGAGSVVVKNLPSNAKAYGNPCRVVMQNK